MQLTINGLGTTPNILIFAIPLAESILEYHPP